MGGGDATKKKKNRNRYGVTTLLNAQKTLAKTYLLVRKVTFCSCDKLYCV